LDNPDFERGEPGEVPPGWFVPRLLADQGFSAAVSTNQPHQGRRCAEIRWPKDRQPSADFANLMQRIDATPWRSKRIKITSAIRVEARTPEARAQMWVRVDRPGGIGAFDNMGDRPVRGASWVDYSTTVEVADDAKTLNVGLMTFAGATAWWDDLRVEVVGEFTTLTEPPRPLARAGLSNLVAFTRLLGYVRHFHPSDQATTNDWLAFIVTALPRIESAENPAALAARLEAAFRPVAPTLCVFETGNEPLLPAELSLSGDAAECAVWVWEHVGYGQDSATGRQDAYRSLRLCLKASEPSPLSSYAQPTNVFRSDVGAGIACLVPTALFADEQGTLPRAEPPSARASDARFSVAHRGARLATVMLTWNVLQHFYPYFDVIDTDWSKELAVALRAAATDTDEAGFYRTLNRLIVALQDGHGSLSGPGSPQVAPIPIKMEQIEGKIVVVAAAVGISELRPGDVVERIDGIAAAEAFEALASQVSAATPRWRNRAASRLGWGPVDRPARLEVRSDDGPVRTVTLARSGTPLQADRKRPPELHEVRPGVFYVDVTRLSQEQFDEALSRLAAAKSLVFDVRGYPTVAPKWLTHLSPKPLQSALWNIPRQHRPGHTDVEWMTDRWNLRPAEPQLTTHRVFLTDGSAISYAESLMGIVEAYRLGEIVGEPTAGTNGNICLVNLPLGYRMVFTGMKVLKHDGSRHHGVGVQPTVSVAQTIEGIRQGRDEQLERALALLRVE
jgi:C-terminal processing protease CtpA/Prc